MGKGSRNRPPSGEIKIVTVPAGVDPKGLTAELQREGLIASPGRFALWLRLTGAMSRIKIEKLHRTFRRRLEAAGIADNERLKSVIPLASIVQAETPIEDEMPIVAGVYSNRLNRPDYPSRRL